MQDKVYPTQERASAPPLAFSDVGHGAVALQMPETAIRKEQEQTLIENQRKERYDQAYGGLGGAPMPAGWGKPPPLPPQRRQRRRRSCCCCCVLSFFATVATIVVIVGIAALVVYLVVRPKAPEMSIKEARVEEFNLTSDGSLNTDMELTIEARNRNKKIKLYYDDVAVKVFYLDQQIGEGSIPAFNQPHHNTSLLSFPLLGHDVTLPSSLQSSLQNDVTLPLLTKAVSKVRFKIGSWKSRRFKIRVYCALQLVGNPRTGAHVSVLSKSCKIKIKFHFFYRTFS